jgi:hypothetical protein
LDKLIGGDELVGKRVGRMEEFVLLVSHLHGWAVRGRCCGFDGERRINVGDKKW